MAFREWLESLRAWAPDDFRLVSPRAQAVRLEQGLSDSSIMRYPATPEHVEAVRLQEAAWVAELHVRPADRAEFFKELRIEDVNLEEQIDAAWERAKSRMYWTGMLEVSETWDERKVDRFVWHLDQHNEMNSPSWREASRTTRGDYEWVAEEMERAEVPNELTLLVCKRLGWNENRLEEAREASREQEQKRSREDDFEHSY